jgi:hypothetical protein
MNMPKRSYIGPALEQRRSQIMQIISQGITQDTLGLEKALLRIGMILETQIVRNIRSQGLINTGNLINSIRYELIRK